MTISDVKNIAVPTLHNYGVQKAGVFGSIAKKTANVSSDIDLLIDFPRGRGYFEFAALKLELEEKLNRKVDLVTYKTIKPALREEILATEVKIL